MRITIAPSTFEGIEAGQPVTTAERPDDTLDILAAVELFAAAMRGYGCTDEMICSGFSAFLREQVIGDTVDTAHC